MCEDLFESIYVPDTPLASSPNTCSLTMTSIRMKEGKSYRCSGEESAREVKDEGE